jgi:acyl carrier protein
MLVQMDESFSFFQSLIQAQFEGTFAHSFDKVSEWTSMQSLIVVSTIDEHYDVLVSHETMKKMQDLESLHAHILHQRSN